MTSDWWLAIINNNNCSNLPASHRATKAAEINLSHSAFANFLLPIKTLNTNYEITTRKYQIGNMVSTSQPKSVSTSHPKSCRPTYPHHFATPCRTTGPEPNPIVTSPASDINFLITSWAICSEVSCTISRQFVLYSMISFLKRATGKCCVRHNHMNH